MAWLAEQLAARGQALGPGDLIITGGLTSAPPLEPGHRISASFGDGRWLAEITRPGLLCFMIVASFGCYLPILSTIMNPREPRGARIGLGWNP